MDILSFNVMGASTPLMEMESYNLLQSVKW